MEGQIGGIKGQPTLGLSSLKNTGLRRSTVAGLFLFLEAFVCDHSSFWL